MTKRRLVCFGMVLVGLLAVFVTVPAVRTRVIGLCKGESTYRGQYTNYWRAEISRWQLSEVSGDGWLASLGVGPIWSRSPTLTESLSRLLGLSSEVPGGWQLPLQEGDAAAVPVLLELVRDRDRKIQRAALQGLQRVGAKARAAGPALLELLGSDDKYIRRGAADAFRAIDPDGATRAGIK